MSGTQVRCAILAGGLGTRLGSVPKGLLEVGGRPILARLLDVVRDAFEAPPILIANDPKASDWVPGLRVASDVVPRVGPLGGLFTGILLAPAPVVCVAWDMPFITASLLRHLADGLGDFDLLIPESGGPRTIEPLCAAYGSGCAEPIAAAIIARDLAASSFHHKVRMAKLPLGTVRALGDPRRLFFSVNTPEDLATARQWASEETGGMGGQT